MQNTVIKEFLDNPHVEVLSFNEGGIHGETREWLETLWSNFYLRGAVLFDADGTTGAAYSQPNTQLPFGRGFIIDRDGDIALPYFGHDPQMVIAEIWRMLGAGRVPDGSDTITGPLMLSKTGGHTIDLTWTGSCLTGDDDYEIYAGTLGDFTSHEPVLCSTDGATDVTLTPPVGESLYYLIVPTNGAFEGSYGNDGAGAPRPQSSIACREMAMTGCE